MKVFRSKQLWHSMLLVSCIFSALISSAHAQNNPYPQKPVKVVVAFTAGGTTDILARIVAQQLTEKLKQSFLIDNKPGAGGNLGTEGSVAFQFKHCGQLIFAPGTSEDKVMEVALEAGAEDVIADDEGAIEVLTSTTDFETVKNALEAAGLMADMAEVTMRAENSIDLSGDDAAKMQKLLDILEDLDDVQNVFHNATISE